MEIYDVLKRDHEEVQQYLSELLTLETDDEYRYVLIEEIAYLLIPHSRAEESIFYNTLRAVGADRGPVMHGFKEHMEAESLLRTLQVMDRMNIEWKGIAEKLKDALDHHIQEEESELFEMARDAFSHDEAEMMAEAFETLKAKIEGEGAVQTTIDMVVNLMPPRLMDKVRHLGERSLD